MKIDFVRVVQKMADGGCSRSVCHGSGHRFAASGISLSAAVSSVHPHVSRRHSAAHRF